MAKPSIEPGAELDGFAIGERVHQGGMATLWSVTHPGINVPLLMKIPRIAEGEDPAAIVSFEMEQMIVPRLAGPHVPLCFGSGDFDRQPYVVIERIPGKTLYDRLGDLPIPYEEARVIAGKIATALADLHRQNVIHHDIKPSSIMFRDSGEAVLIDFGLSHHNQLPDLLQEEFRLPYGTAPYMAPERLLGVRDDPRSDLFSLGVLLYFFTTGVRPFGESETLRGMKRRLWRDPYPPRQLRPDYPPWLQEIVLRCLEIEPVWRHPTASQLAFALAHPDQVKLTARSERLQRDPITTVWRRRFNRGLTLPKPKSDVAAQLASGPIVAVAIDTEEGSGPLNECLRVTAEQLLATLPSARLACINVLKLGRITIDRTLDEEGNNKHIDRLVALRHWASPLKLDESRLTVHVLEAIDPASAILEFTGVNQVDHIVIGARQNSMMRMFLGSVSAKVATEAACTVTVVRPPRSAMALVRQDGRKPKAIEAS
ncbi:MULTISPECIES: bifunctional serine/threonine-protein kinase/universal stress protein [unclassified Bradyrhizobium]|uniref:bifunctional serine/threonine-protein kinase/universal stress protein n=1 Tax=unclassified Bradyrhizobium TaxID=2631580 RepID=UPI001BAC50DB|nr:MULTISPECIES: bifunctional serine/threonine-protein kinase/universal stress protein [unclassified Bradyrhizobium]MBR1226010.1 protein kinase [Bradyrhizobium sp. AUGA SZCCT0176]MBR1296963.1 protein kinase [Bradyrhizobium sp. AUGA SZCCT0042]